MAKRVGSALHMNPSPGNIRDGLITDAIKSAGAAKKGGTSPVVDVLDYTEPSVKPGDRKSTRLNSSHRTISYAVFCLKKKKINTNVRQIVKRDELVPEDRRDSVVVVPPDEVHLSAILEVLSVLRHLNTFYSEDNN